jgi:hypothetical protein
MEKTKTRSFGQELTANSVPPLEIHIGSLILLVGRYCCAFQKNNFACFTPKNWG